MPKKIKPLKNKIRVRLAKENERSNITCNFINFILTVNSGDIVIDFLSFESYFPIDQLQRSINAYKNEWEVEEIEYLKYKFKRK